MAENIKLLGTPEIAEITEKFSPYLKEFRKRAYFTLIVFVVALIAGLLFYEQIIKFLIDILDLEGINIVFTSPFEFLELIT